ncbi:MAG: N-acetylmuramoyl-L-alanine amidase [Alphaproteobacteria bacterium]|nr:N-acetylmuramoyl-L-alanine amidase [Alphaproteobacteria bacterium]MBL6936827.1 N-acetylmuramoyl-L-alanine amidase [Alphaproteobacteria bacterium]MBL7097596.1 N-acetylmuramoyl-L-alanine amidase [Alphaproteobacteria bacterium]
MTLRIVSCPSPNHDARTEGQPVDILVLHYTGMPTADEALARLTDPQAKVSAHYTIGRDGRVFAHVPEDRRAWHAGVSWWAGATNINARSIGIELVNPGHEFGYVPFAEPQIAALIDLAQAILRRHPIPPQRVLGHSDVAPARKEDPGEHFPWKQLAEFGIGLWPAGKNGKGEATPQDLARFGYGLPPHTDVPLDKVITAFQRHFRPSEVNGRWDGECAAALASLLAPRAIG